MEGKSQLTGSIVTYKNEPAQLRRAIDSVLNSSFFNLLYIVDNSENECLRDLFTDNKIEYIKNISNIGFGAAHNIAIKRSISSGAKYHLILNPDVSFEPWIIGKILNYMNQNPEIGLLMPEILYPDGRIQYLPKLLPSPFQLIKRRIAGKSSLLKNWTNSYEMRHVPAKNIYEAPIISGCFSFCRIEAFLKAGVYDDQFFMYFEDFDLSRRIHRYFKTVYFPLVSVYHEYERGAQYNKRLLFIFLNSAMKYFNKWGWFFDNERVAINKATLKKIK